MHQLEPDDHLFSDNYRSHPTLAAIGITCDGIPGVIVIDFQVAADAGQRGAQLVGEVVVGVLAFGR